MTNAFETAASEFRDYLESNPNIKSALYKLSMTNENVFNNEEVKQGFASANLENPNYVLSTAAVDFFASTLETIRNDFSNSDERDIDLNHFVDERLSLLNAAKEIDSDDITPNRSFRDLHLEKNKEPSEQVFYDTAKAFLSPEQFNEAINENKTLAEVVNEVNNSEIFKFITFFAAEEPIKEMEGRVEEKQQNMENPLSANVGFTQNLEEALNTLEEASAATSKKPDPTPASDSFGKGRIK